jgi:nucleoside-diphosphate-sugar epimerase
MVRFLVTGATGLIGRHLTQQLLSRGHEVAVLTRNDRYLGPGEESVVVRRGDLRDRSSLTAAMAGCEIVMHAAGELFDRDQMYATNVGGTINLLTALPAAVKRVVVVSSIGVIGPAAKGKVSERAPCHPDSMYESTKLEAEMAALEFGERTGIPVVALRPTNVFGEGTKADSFTALLRAVQSGRFAYFGRRAVSNYVYAGDVADACLAASQSEVRGVVHVNDPCSLEDFISAAAACLQVRAPSTRVPRVVGLAAGAAMQAAGFVIRKRSPLTLNRVRALSSTAMYVSDRIPGELAWQPRFGFVDGLLRTIAHYRNVGLL